MTISEFYKKDFVDYASYSTLRMLASAIDGQKNAQRKIISTLLDKNIKTDIKVSQLNSKMAEYCEYLHGDSSGVISGMAQEFAGTNNIPLLAREGNFGNRFNNEASAPRYIYTYGNQDLFSLFNNTDREILDKQFFEGTEIEPKFYVPSLPMLLVNGADGVATGFAQKILPRNPKKLKKYITDYLNNSLKPNKSNSLEPYFEGFNGTIQQGESSKQWKIFGTIERINSTRIIITEIPVQIELKAYLKVLDRLEENGTIRNYKDQSEKSFQFEVNFPRNYIDKLSDEKLLDKLKLIKTITENYTAIDENIRVKTFENAKEILEYYIDIKLQYLQKRKTFLITKIQQSIELDNSKYLFIKHITDGTLLINKRKKGEVEKDLEKIEGILLRDESYDYLLNMSIISLTKERMLSIQEKINTQKEELKIVQKNSTQEMWLVDLNEQ